jgi:regulator of sigma E protease
MFLTELFASLFGANSVLVGTIIPFLFVLTVVVFVHEMGHYLVGRWCGIGVSAFSVGFGPELIGFNDRHGTRWKLCAIPLGGYVKFVGDINATSAPDQVEMDKLTAAERKVAFHTQPVWKRAATVFAGPLFNFLLTIAVFAVFFAAYGRPVADPMVAEVRPGSPAAIAGFMPGDRFVSVDGNKVETFADVQRYVSGRTGDALSFVLMRNGKEVMLVATPEPMEQKDALGNTIRVGVIGVINNQQLGQPRIVTYSVPGAVVEAVRETGHILARTGSFLTRFAAGREDKCQLGGPVKIADMAGKAAKLGFEWLVQLVAVLSVGIGFLNLLPIPPLDGGHLVFYAVEAAIGRPVSGRAMEMVYRAGFLLVLGFMGFVFWNDLFGC